MLSLGFGGSLFLRLALLGFRGVCLIRGFLLRSRLVLSLKREGNFAISLLLLLLSTRCQVSYRETARLSVKLRQKILTTRSAFIFQGSECSLAFVAAALGALHLPRHKGGGLCLGICRSARVRLRDNLRLEVVLSLRTVRSIALMSSVICLECTVLMHLCRGVVRELELVVHLDVAVKAFPVLGLSSVHWYVGSEVVPVQGDNLLAAMILLLLGVHRALAHLQEGVINFGQVDCLLHLFFCSLHSITLLADDLFRGGLRRLSRVVPRRHLRHGHGM